MDVTIKLILDILQTNIFNLISNNLFDYSFLRLYYIFILNKYGTVEQLILQR
jgi:hypothetical protein